MKTKQQQKNEAHKAYEAIEKPAYKAYLAIRKPGLEAYEAIEEPAYKAYEAIREPAYEAYEAKLKKIDKQEEEGETIIKVKGKRYKLIED